MMGWFPSPKQVVQEAGAVILGAAIAAFVFSKMPRFKKWVAERLPTASP